MEQNSSEPDVVNTWRRGEGGDTLLVCVIEVKEGTQRDSSYEMDGTVEGYSKEVTTSVVE